jgi:hypothetical protein
MKRKEDNMMLSVNDDSHDDLVDEIEGLISEIFDDLVDDQLTLIFETCLVESFEVDLVDDEVKYVNERISKKL